jgi:YD repeat-containing protein
LANSFYGDSYAYSATTAFDNSPLNRTRQQFGAGNAWRSADKKIQNFDESAGTDVRYYYIDGSGNIGLSGTYPANSLYKKRQVDEQGHTSIEISDKRGRLVQKQQQDDTGYITTCYLYDGMGRILAVIQPQGYELNQSITKNSTEWQRWVFWYEYDYRGRMRLKHVPASGDEYFVYDKWDRLVWSQTALQREGGKWTFYKYDAFNQEIMRGDKSESRDLPALENETWAWSGARYESRVSDGIYYSISNSYPQLSSDADLRHITYYDYYTHWLPAGMAFADGGTAFHAQHPEAQGWMVGSRSRSGNSWLVSVVYYDNKARVIRTFAHNLYDQIEQVDAEYNHAGEILRTKKLHKNQAGVATTKTKIYQYDHAGRKTSYQLQLGNINNETITAYEYDEIGRMKRKTMLPNGTYSTGGTPAIITRPPNPANNTQDLATQYIQLQPGTSITAGGSNTYQAKIVAGSGGSSIAGLQTVDYQYHLRGWLKGINLDANGNPTPATSQGDLWSYKLEYETAGYWDGNIGKQLWHNGTDSRSYQYTYDAASRLKSATYAGINTENFSLPNMSYDKNGNITALQRKGKNGGSFGDIDNLTYYYSGNRLTGVTDAVSGNEDVGDFRDNGSNSDYTYYNDGSLKSDANKGISLIEYDSYLQKVKQVTFSNGNWVKWFYDGAGTLLKRQLSNGDVWEYADDFLYKNAQLYQINDDEGRITYSNGVYSYEFEYRDHQNNLRVGFKGDNGQLIQTQTAETDPFGLEIRSLSNNGASSQNYRFQNQEKVSDFGLNLNWFKYRPFDPQIGRGWQVDRLASGYAHNSVYAFSENKVIRHVELDGLEAIPVYPNPIGELFSATGFRHNPGLKESNEIGGKLLKMAGEAFLTVSLLVVPVEEFVVAGVAALGAKVEGMLLKEAIVTTTTEVRVGGQAAKSSANLDKLNRQLASESQMAEAGTPIAGAGAKKPLNKANDMATQYGGQASDYGKKGSSSYTANDGTKIETHWEENTKTGERFNIKTKLNNEEAPTPAGKRYQEKLDKIKQ